ncbi:MAG: hypothetical protein ABH810_03625 [bacterium]
MKTKVGKLLTSFIKDFVIVSLDSTEAFLLSAGSAKLLAQNMNMKNREYYSAIQGLQRRGYIKKNVNKQFLITPRGLKKARRLLAEESDYNARDWDGSWRIITFDVPNHLESQRNMFRSAIKRHGFIGLQKSVFISPFADFEKLATLRDDLGIEKFVTFFIAKVPPTENDQDLRKKFKLK